MRSRQRNRQNRVPWTPRHLLVGGQGQQWDLGCPILTGYPGGSLQSISRNGVILSTVGGTSPGLITTSSGSGLNIAANNTTRALFPITANMKMRIVIAFSMSASTQSNGGILSLYGSGGADYQSKKFVMNRVGTTAAIEVYSENSKGSFAVDYDRTYLVEMVFDGTTCHVLKNAVEEYSFAYVTSDLSAVSGLQIGGREFDSPTYSMRGAFYECLLFRTDLPRDYKKLQGYLHHKRNFARDLPESHPFRYKIPMMGDPE